MLSTADLHHIKDAEINLRGRVAARRASIMVVTLIVYDILTTLDREVRYVWRGRRTFAKVIFITNRYLALICFGLHIYLQCVPSPSPEVCHMSINADLYMGISLSMIATVVIMLQVWALYNRTKAAFCIILGLYLACVIPSWVVVGGDYLKFARALGHLPRPNYDDIYAAVPELRVTGVGCKIDAYPPSTYSLFVSSLVWESLVVVAILWRVFYWDGFRDGVIRHLYRDGLVYYISMMIILVAGIVTARADQLSRAAVASGFVPGLKSIMVSHLLLRLKGFLSESSLGPDTETNQVLTTSGIEFAPGHRSTTILTTTLWASRELTIDVECGADDCNDVELDYWAAPNRKGGEDKDPAIYT